MNDPLIEASVRVLSEAPAFKETPAEWQANSAAAKKLARMDRKKAYELIKQGQVSERVFWLFCSELESKEKGEPWPPHSGGPGPRGWGG